MDGYMDQPTILNLRSRQRPTPTEPPPLSSAEPDTSMSRAARGPLHNDNQGSRANMLS